MKPMTSDVLRLLKERGSLTQNEALRLIGCGRLAPRICELRAEGYEVGVVPERNRKRKGTHARYFLEAA